MCHQPLRRLRVEGGSLEATTGSSIQVQHVFHWGVDVNSCDWGRFKVGLGTRCHCHC